MNPSNPDPDRRSEGDMPNAGNGTMRENLEENVRGAKHAMGNQAREEANAGKKILADETNRLSSAIDAAASNLDEHDREGLARYARNLSSTLANAAGQLEARSVNELANDAKRLARDNPALFMLGSIAVGFGLSRFFKATAERHHHDNDTAARTDAYSNNGSASALIRRHAPDVAQSYATMTAPGNGNGRDM